MAIEPSAGRLLRHPFHGGSSLSFERLKRTTRCASSMRFACARTPTRWSRAPQRDLSGRSDQLRSRVGALHRLGWKAGGAPRRRHRHSSRRSSTSPTRRRRRPGGHPQRLAAALILSSITRRCRCATRSRAPQLPPQRRADRPLDLVEIRLLSPAEEGAGGLPRPPTAVARLDHPRLRPSIQHQRPGPRCSDTKVTQAHLQARRARA